VVTSRVAAGTVAASTVAASTREASRVAGRQPPARSGIGAHNRSLGQRGEQLAADWYTSHGYEVVARNWRCREGELDLVARHGRTVVVCEVKTRGSDAFGSPLEAVTPAKQARLRRLAARWLREEASGPAGVVRFDVVSVLRGTLEVIEGAF
jgi:putative endonuclease